jgi:tRNA-dihydrouridine synthase B
MLSFYGENTAIRIARKHMAWYAKGLDDSAEYRSKVNQSDSASKMINTIDEYFTRFF